MPAGLDTVAGRLESHQPNAGIVEERVENPDGIGSSPDACGYRVRQSAGLILDLRARLQADDSLKITHHDWEGMRSGRRAEAVVGVVGVGNPVPECLVDGIFER